MPTVKRLVSRAAKAFLDTFPGERSTDAFLLPRYTRNGGTYSLTVCEDVGVGTCGFVIPPHAVASHAVMSGENLPPSAACSDTDGTEPPQLHTPPTSISSRRRSGLVRSLRQQWGDMAVMYTNYTPGETQAGRPFLHRCRHNGMDAQPLAFPVI